MSRSRRHRVTPGRSGAAVAEFAAAAAGDGNLMPAMIEAFRADLTIGEVTDVLIDQFGSVNPSRRTDLGLTNVGA